MAQTHSFCFKTGLFLSQKTELKKELEMACYYAVEIREEQENKCWNI